VVVVDVLVAAVPAAVGLAGRAGPTAMVTAPVCMVTLDRDAQHRAALMRRLPLRRAFGARRVVPARRGALEVDSVLANRVGDVRHVAPSLGRRNPAGHVAAPNTLSSRRFVSDGISLNAS